MITIVVCRPVDHAQRYAATQARLRMADTHKALDQAIVAVDAVCATIVKIAPKTRAEVELQQRALEWMHLGPGFIKAAHDALVSRQLYRERRVAADRPYARKANRAVGVRHEAR